MYKLASNGAKVIHPRAVSSAMKFGVPVRVRSTYADDEGTLITDKPTMTEKKIIGIALDKTYSGITAAYILPQPEYAAYIKEKIEYEIFNKAIQVLEKVYYDDSIELLMEGEQVADNIRLIQLLA
jgi:aspartate kinase